MKRVVRVPAETRLQPSPIALPETNVERLRNSTRGIEGLSHPARTEKGGASHAAAVLRTQAAAKVSRMPRR